MHNGIYLEENARFTKLKGPQGETHCVNLQFRKFPGRHDLQIRAFKCKSVSPQVHLLISGHIGKTNPSFGLCWKEKRMHVKFFPKKWMRVSGIETQALDPSWTEPPFSSPKGRLKKGGFWAVSECLPMLSASCTCAPLLRLFWTDILSSLTCLDTTLKAPDPRAGSMRYSVWVCE